MKEKKINIMSLFDGMSCGQIAANRAGLGVNKYYASEIDKHAISITMKNWPKTIQLGNVSNWEKWDIDWSKIDLLIGGSPCQGFSFSGKQLAFNDPRSKLFFIYIDILNHIKKSNPNVKFMLENVKMKKEHLDVITKSLKENPICINSANVSAQNRIRYYWTNWKIDQPKIKAVTVNDILEKTSNLPILKVNDNNRVKKITENDRGYRPHRGDVKSTGISELGRLLKPNAKTDTITASHAPKLALNDDINNLLYRKLSPIECERLQTVSDNYTKGVSDTQRYKMLGNGWTVDVIKHIFKMMT